MLEKYKWVSTVVLSLALLSSLDSIVSGQLREGSIRPRRVLASGIITDRLSNNDLQRWSRIKRIIFSTDAKGQPLHPILIGLWNEMACSPHAIYIEFGSSTHPVTNTAGAFRIEVFDPQGRRHQAAIQLNPETIDAALVGECAARPNGLIPFQMLGKDERYAEVLGHEMAHATSILGDQPLTKRVEEMVEQTNKTILSQVKIYGNMMLTPELRKRIDQRDGLLLELEQHAEAVELSVWREIIRGREERIRTPQRNFPTSY